ncbi:MAG TPA: hypothetical protein V6C76_03645 [Drouetiella sp.]
MINKAIYLYTLRRIARHYIFYVIAFGFVFVMPILSFLDPNAGSSHNDSVSSYTCSLLFGLSIIVSLNIAGGGSAQGGGTDYLPLILSRPVSRAQYIFTKWLTLATVTGTVSIAQLVVLCALGEPLAHHWTLLMFFCAVVERVLDAFSVSIALVMVSLLPTRQLFGYGVIALELIGLNHLILDFDFYIPSYSSTTVGVLRNLGVLDWLHKHILPLMTSVDPSTVVAGGTALFNQMIDLVAPRFYVFDFLTNSTFDLYPLVTYAMNLCMGLIICTLMLNWRDINYATE